MAAEDRTSRRTQLVGGRRRGRARAFGMLAADAYRQMLESGRAVLYPSSGGGG
jgi:hypothetical protein